MHTSDQEKSLKKYELYDLLEIENNLELCRSFHSKKSVQARANVTSSSDKELS